MQKIAFLLLMEIHLFGPAYRPVGKCAQLSGIKLLRSFFPVVLSSHGIQRPEHHLSDRAAAAGLNSTFISPVIITQQFYMQSRVNSFDYHDLFLNDLFLFLNWYVLLKCASNLSAYATVCSLSAPHPPPGNVSWRHFENSAFRKYSHHLTFSTFCS